MSHSLRKSNLQREGDDPFKMLERINDIAYKTYLLDKYQISATFNINDLSHYDVGDVDDDKLNLSTNSFKEG